MDTTVSAVELRSRLAHGDDIRRRRPHRRRVRDRPHTRLLPRRLDTLREHRDEFRHIDALVVLACQSGNRAAQAAERLTEADLAKVEILDGGIARWVANGGQVNHGRQRWTLERQVRLTAGAIVLASTLTSLALPAASAIAGLVGAGLVVAALSDTGAMANLLARLPYNHGATCDVRAVVRELTDQLVTSETI